MANRFTDFFKSISNQLSSQSKKDTSDKEVSQTKEPIVNGIPLNVINALNYAINESFSDIDIEDSDRLYRYSQYIMALSRIPEQARAIGLVQDLILNPLKLDDDYIKVQPKIKDTTDANFHASSSVIEELVNLLKLDDILPRVVFDTLLYGDAFVEIVYMPQKQVLNNIKTKSQKNIGLIVHDPKKIIIVKDKQDNIYGYVEVIDEITFSDDFFNAQGGDFQAIIDTIHRLKDPTILFKNEPNDMFAESVNNALKEDKYRFIPDKSMGHVTLTQNNMYYPYGTSYFEAIRQIINSILIIEMSVVVYRLVRQPSHLKYKIDVSAIDPIQIPAFIEQMKQTIRSTNAVSTDLTTQPLQQTVKLVTMFDDYWIPIRNGTPLYDMEWLPGEPMSVQLDDLNYLHKKLLSGLGIPPSYLGYEEPLSGVATVLLIQDQRVARLVHKFQKDIVGGLSDLLSKICSILGYLSDFNNVNISLQEIKTADSTYDLEDLQNKANLLNQFLAFGMNKRFILKEILKYTDEQIDEQLKVEPIPGTIVSNEQEQQQEGPKI